MKRKGRLAKLFSCAIAVWPAMPTAAAEMTVDQAVSVLMQVEVKDSKAFQSAHERLQGLDQPSRQAAAKKLSTYSIGNDPANRIFDIARYLEEEGLPIIMKLADSPTQSQGSALWYLGNLKSIDQNIFNLLLKYATGSDGRLRSLAIPGVAKHQEYDPAKALAAVQNAAADSDVNYRLAALSALFEFTPMSPETFDILMDRLEAADDYEREQLTSFFGWNKKPIEVPDKKRLYASLLKIYHSEANKTTKLYAQKGMERLGPSAADEVTVDALSAENPGTRQLGLQALAKNTTPSKAAIEPLVKMARKGGEEGAKAFKALQTFSSPVVSNGQGPGIRETADLQAKVLAPLKPEETVAVVNRGSSSISPEGGDNYWYEVVNASGIRGWVYGGDLKIASPPQQGGSRGVALNGNTDAPQPGGFLGVVLRGKAKSPQAHRKPEGTVDGKVRTLSVKWPNAVVAEDGKVIYQAAENLQIRGLQYDAAAKSIFITETEGFMKDSATEFVLKELSLAADKKPGVVARIELPRGGAVERLFGSRQGEVVRADPRDGSMTIYIAKDGTLKEILQTSGGYASYPKYLGFIRELDCLLVSDRTDNPQGAEDVNSVVGAFTEIPEPIKLYGIDVGTGSRAVLADLNDLFGDEVESTTVNADMHERRLYVNRTGLEYVAKLPKKLPVSKGGKPLRWSRAPR